MPNIAYWHPQVVHFVVGLLFVGVALRLASLAGKWKWTGPAAATLIFLGTAAAVLAVKSGTDAHGPAERIPGARNAVVEHEELGERARNIFFVVAALEIAGLALSQRPWHRWVLGASGVVGLGGLLVVAEAAEHGGELVYNYAGNVGLRSGDPADVQRLLLAGLYQQAMQDRAAKRPEAAARTLEQLAARFPEDPGIQLLRAESQVLDLKDGKAALTSLAGITIPPDNPQLQTRFGFIKADAYVVAGFPDSARATLEVLGQAFPANQRIKQRLEQLRS